MNFGPVTYIQTESDAYEPTVLWNRWAQKLGGAYDICGEIALCHRADNTGAHSAKCILGLKKLLDGPLLLSFYKEDM